MASKNPFDDDDDVNPAYGGSTPQNDELNFYQQQIGSSLNESLASTQRSLQLLNESEETGAATAQVIEEKHLLRITYSLSILNDRIWWHKVKSCGKPTND